MPLEFVDPWMLALLPLGVLLWWLARASAAPLTPARARASLALRVFIFVCLVFALSDPRWLGSTRNLHVMWIVDVSDSVRDNALEAAREFTAEAGAPPPGSSRSWLTFAAAPRPHADETQAIESPREEAGPAATDIEAALQFAAATFPVNQGRLAVVFSDGVETEGEARMILDGLADAGVRVHTVPVEPPDDPEVLVQSLSAPAEVNEGEPFVLRANIVSNRATTAEVDVFQNGIRVASQPVELREGSNPLDLTQTVPADSISEFTVTVRAAEDTLADNNTASTQVRSRGEARVLMVSDNPAQARPLQRALQAEGIRLEVRPEAGLPGDLGELQGYDALLIDNVPATAMNRHQQEILASYVRDFGGGFVMLGGENAFGLGGYRHTPVDDVLPVRSEFEKEQELPSVALVLVVDRSGSMRGEKMEMARSAARAAVELLGPRDYAGVVAFDHEAFWVADLQSTANRQAIIERIARIEAGGGTNIAPGLQMALDALRPNPAKIKHVILLTDGISVPGPFYEITTQMAAERMTVSAVAVGADSDTQLLQQIAHWGGGRYYFTDSPETIPQILTRETMMASRSALQDFPFRPVVARSADFLAGVGLDEAPFLLGHVSTKPKATSELWLLTENAEPLLATWRYGLGQAAAFTSDARNRWGSEWLRWPQFGAFWAQLIRRVMRPADLRRLPVEVSREAGGFRVAAEVTGPLGGFLDHADAEAVVLRPDGTPIELTLEKTAPGRYETWWPATEPGPYHVQLSVTSNGSTVASQYESVTLGFPDEYLPKPPDLELLRDIAEATGGKFQPDPRGIFRDRPLVSAVERELWPWFVLLALCLFVADVGVRRVKNDSGTPG